MKYLLFKSNDYHLSLPMDSITKIDKKKPLKKNIIYFQKNKKSTPNFYIITVKNKIFGADYIISEYEYKKDIIENENIINIIGNKNIKGFLLINETIYIILDSNYKIRRRY